MLSEFSRTPTGARNYRSSVVATAKILDLY